MVAASALLAGKPLRAQSGQVLYQSNCAGCHGLDARGGEHAPNIATARRVQQLSDVELLRIIRDGIPASGMPAFGTRVKSERLLRLVSYLRSLQDKLKTVSLPGNPESGHELFFHRGGCSECHMIAGKGGFMAADLTSYASAHSVEQIWQAIVDPNANLDPREALATVVGQNGRRYSGIIRNEDSGSLQLQSLDGTFQLFEKSEIVNAIHEEKSPMPADYKSQLTPEEVNDLISYLIEAASKHPKPTLDTSDRDETQ